ncbi:MAG: Fic family protein [Segniliparus sp.]|uniref:Fic family protein n=1 Tax=Segniliparus sp. TaxID=2804064 RepID=UPI003F39416F
MRFLTEDDVFWAGRVACRWHLTVRDSGALSTALFEHAAIYGMDLFERAAALLFFIAFTEPFAFGNKITAWTATCLFLDLNNHVLRDDFDPEKAAGLVLGATDGNLARPQIIQELRELFEWRNPE